jgi:hypothetical protein
MTVRGWTRWVAVAIGLGDALTGIALLLVPGLVLRGLGLPATSEIVWLRFVGAFVLGVGVATVEPAVLGAMRRLPGALSATATVRIAVSATLALLVLEGALPAAWVLVAAWDALAALIQLVTLRGLDALG